MKYVKVLGLEDKRNQLGYYNRERNFVVIDFTQGPLRATLTSYHEFLHRILAALPIEDWLDLFDPLLQLSTLKNPKRCVEIFKAIFLTKHQACYPLEDPQRHACNS